MVTLEDDLALVFKALSDPTRRRILDLLRDQPRTTGELCAAIPLSRYAVMKHLTVLEQAGLIVVRRRGRDRWNHLNAVPLQQVHERWLHPFETQWAAALLRLKRANERQGGMDVMLEVPEAAKLELLRIELEIAIEAPRERVFQALVGDISAWWGAPYLIGARAEALVLEPKLGGRFYEDWGGGQGALWGVVTVLRTNECVEFTGACAMAGAVHAVVCYQLEARGEGTLLKFSHRAMGEVNEKQQHGYSAGWQDLLGTRLRAWVERGERYGLGHEPSNRQ